MGLCSPPGTRHLLTTCWVPAGVWTFRVGWSQHPSCSRSALQLTRNRRELGVHREPTDPKGIYSRKKHLHGGQEREAQPQPPAGGRAGQEQSARLSPPRHDNYLPLHQDQKATSAALVLIKKSELPTLAA